MLHLIATPAQKLSLATVPPMPVMKWTSSPFTTSYLALSDSTQTQHSNLQQKHKCSYCQKNANNKFCLHNSSSRDGEYLADFSLKNRVASPKREGKPWTYTYPNDPQVHPFFISRKKKWINNALNCEVYSSFERASPDHGIVLAKISISQRKNKTKTVKTTKTAPHLPIVTLDNNIR